MADVPSAGGGKIRSRRAASSRKPYSRATSQRKSLFSRVTDSFKTLLNPITPKWLTNRLNHDHDGSRETLNEDNVESQAPSTSANHQGQKQVLTNNNYKKSPLSRPPLSAGASASSLQYYVTPPDVSIVTPPAQPEHSAASSGGKQDLLKHLAMSSKRQKLSEEPSPVREESLMRREMKYLTANDNASIASSSGCSSSMQAPSQRTNTSAEQEGSQRNLWSSSMDSLASSKTSSQQQLTMTSHKRPRFNPAIFSVPALGSPARNTDVLQSSFYNGPVQYGGASASARSPYFATPYKVPSVTKVKVRHVNHQRTPSASSSHSSRSSLDDTSAAGMSSTAKKILQTLERMSSPLKDARKIPSVARTPSTFMADRQRRRTIGSSSMLGTSFQAPPTMGLSTPSSARIRRSVKIPLNNSLVMRNAQKTSNAKLQKPTSESSTVSPPDSTLISTRGVPAPLASLSSTESMTKPQRQPMPTEGGGGGGGKMKSHRRTTSHYSAMHEDREEQEEPDLPSVALPLSGTSHLPSFNFGKSLMTSTPAVSTQNKKDSMQPEFNFSSPVVKTTKTEQVRTSADTPKFQFSSPPTRATSSSSETGTPKSHPLSNFTPGSKPSTPSLVFAPDPQVVSAVRASKRRSSPPPVTHESPQREGGFRPAEKLKAGSVMDILSGKSKKEEQVKEPSVTPNPLTQVKSGWDCDTCLVRNDATADKCAACETPKPGGAKKTQVLSGAKSNKGWDCGTCLVPNDAGAEKCVACETPRPGSAPGKTQNTFKPTVFKPPSNSGFSFGIPKTTDGKVVSKKKNTWECGTCLVPNEMSRDACEACETPRPGAAPKAKSSTPAPKFGLSSTTTSSGFKFGIPDTSTANGSTPSSSWGSQFKKSSGTWECEMCMVANPADRKTCEACESPKPGTEKQETLNSSFKFGQASSGLFKFGIPDAKAESVKRVDEKKTQDDSDKQDKKVTFGISNKTSETETSKPAPTFAFGTPSTAASSDGKSGNDEVPKAGPAFSFGVKKNEQAAPDNKGEPAAKKPPLFSFGPPKKAETNTEAKLPAFTAPASTTGFTGFGAPTSSATTSTQQPLTGTVATSSARITSIKSLFGGPTQTTQSSAPPPYGAPTTTASQASISTPVGGSIFGAPSTTTSDTTSKAEEKPAAPTFAFGSSNPSSGAMFQFSGSAAKTSAPADVPQSAGFPFGTKPTDAPTSKQSVGFSFGAKPADAAPSSTGFSFGSKESAPSSNMFGSGTTTSAPSTNPSPFGGFGTNVQSAITKQPDSSTSGFKGFNFSSSKQQTTQQTTGSMFGSGSAPTTNPTPFGSSSAAPTPFGSSTTNPMPFGAPQANSAAGNMFGRGGSSAPAFGAPVANETNSGIPKPSFAFGANQATEQKPSGFQFGGNNSASSNNTQSAAGFNFGTPTNKPATAFGSSQSSGFQFGAPQQQQANGVFQFGSGSNQPKPDATENKSMFVFGGNNPAGSGAGQQQPSTGFSFGASTNAAASFNFGSTQPATPQGGSMFSVGSEAPPNQNPFSATAGRSSTPVQGRRLIRTARRKLRK